MNRLEAFRYLKQELENMQIQDAEQEAKHALSALFSCEVGDLFLYGDKEVEGKAQKEIQRMIKRRKDGEPLAYIIGERWFMGLPFYVDKNVLIPRQETELLAEAALELIQQKGLNTMLDLCTGSGCVALGVAKQSRIKVDASDISGKALAVAKKNAALHGVDIGFIQSDLFEHIRTRYDLITANPPYVTQKEMQALQKEVRFEPALALYGGQDGLSCYRSIAQNAADHLHDGGYLLMEIGSTQKKDVISLFVQEEFDIIEVRKDYSGFDRVMIARKPGGKDV